MPAVPPPTVTLADGLSREYLLHHRVCPRAFAPGGSRLVRAAAPDALIGGCLGDLLLAYRCPVEVEPAPLAEVEAMIERMCAGADRAIELAGALRSPHTSTRGSSWLRRRRTTGR